MIDKRILERRLRRQREAMETLLGEPFKPRFAARHLSLDRELLMLTGTRGTGKTTLALNVLSQGGKKFAYVDFSDLKVSSEEESLGNLLEVLYMVYGTFEWIVADEFLSVKEWEIVLRFFRVMDLKVFAVSSGILPREAQSRFPGVLTLYPLSFSEYCLWHDIPTEPSTPLERGVLRLGFDDFSLRGGMPSNQYKVRLKMNSQKLLDSILSNDLKGDVRKSKLAEIEAMARHLASKSPVSVFYNEITEKFRLRSETTAKKYLSVIKGAGALYPLERFAFQDKMRNYGEREFVIDPCLYPSGASKEQKLKTIVYMQLRRFCERYGYQMYYYGNRHLECDFVLCHEMKMRTIIQVIYDYSDSEAIKEKVASLIALSSSSGCGKLFILTDNCHDTIEAKGLNIYVKPVYEFLLDRSHMII